VSAFEKLWKLSRLRVGLPHIRRADRHRDQSDWIEAVLGYRRGLELMPWREDLKVQIGNCLKEFGDYQGAAKSYSSVKSGASLLEAQKQIADVNRRSGSIILPYAIAGSPEVLDGANASDLPLPAVTARLLPNRIKLEKLETRRWLGTLGQTDNLAVRVRGNGYATIKLDQIGSLSIERDSVREPLLTGVVAIRGRILSLGRLETAGIFLGEGDGANCIAMVELKPVELGSAALKLHVFNVWIDCARLLAGRHWLSIRVGRKITPAGLFVSVQPESAIGMDMIMSNSFVPSLEMSGASVDDAVAATPAQIRPAARSVFDQPVRSILAIRADQLGDVSASLPALARLREIFPEAELTVLVQPIVHAMIEASGIADRVLSVALQYDARSEKRHLAINEEARLRLELGERKFDLAIDLCPGDETRPLLLLSDALYMVGFNPDRFTFLDFGISVRSRDKVNQLERLSHAATVQTLVEALAVAVSPARRVVPRAKSSEVVLEAHGLTKGGYVVVHTGARHPINQWPVEKFLDLAARLVRESGLPVFLFLEQTAEPPGFPSDVRDQIKLSSTLDPDAFDAIIANARVMVGNDSGPKHLAATRGVPTVSIHVDRLNWNEWGQDGQGAIVSKRVPCTGCGLNDIQLCGRSAVCIRSIEVEEVLEAVRLYSRPELD
jgi:ADP-heptose:LPS heptosyltransferase